MKNYDMIIIGSGISSSSMAIKLALKNKKVLVLEKSKHLGGAIETCNYNNYFFELGSHTVYHSYSSLIKLIEEAGFSNLINGIIKQKYYFYKEKEFKKLLLDFNKLEFIYSTIKSLGLKKDKLTVKKYYSNKFGTKNYNNFIKNFLKAVLCQNPDNFPSSIVLKRRKIKNKNYPKNISFEKGLQTIINNFLSHKNIETLTEKEVLNITKDNNDFIIECNDLKFKTKNVTIATDPNSASLLCKNIAPKLETYLKDISYTNINSLSLVFDKNCKTTLFAGLLFYDKNFNSVVSRDSFYNENYRAFTIHSENENNEKLLLNKLLEILSMKKENILYHKFRTIKFTSFRKNHIELSNKIQQEVKNIEGLYLTGNYFYGLSLEDCVLRSQEEAQRYLKKF